MMRVGEAAQQHHQRQHDVHDADPLVIDAGDPFVPEIGQMALDDDPGEHADDRRARRRPRRPSGSAGRTGSPPSSACRACHRSACDARCALGDCSVAGPAPGGSSCDTIVVEQAGLDAAERATGAFMLWLGQLGVGRRVSSARPRPRVALRPRRRTASAGTARTVEMHVGEAVAAEMRGQAPEGAGLVGLQVAAAVVMPFIV